MVDNRGVKSCDLCDVILWLQIVLKRQTFTLWSLVGQRDIHEIFAALDPHYSIDVGEANPKDLVDGEEG